MSILEIYDVDVNTKRWTWSRWKLSICYCFDIFLAKIFIIIDALLRFKNFQTTCFNTNTRVHTILLNITTILLVFQDVFKKKEKLLSRILFRNYVLSSFYTFYVPYEPSYGRSFPFFDWSISIFINHHLSMRILRTWIIENEQ